MGYAKKVDASQALIVSALLDVGATVINMTGDPMNGFDLLVIFRGVVRIVEVKNATDPPSARLLTKREARRKWEVEQAGGTYYVWMSADDALKAIGVL